jgi:hypothetical protein
VSSKSGGKKSAQGKSKLDKAPNNRPFRPAFEGLGVITLIFGYMVTGSHNVLSFWIYAVAATFTAYGLPLPRRFAPTITILALIVASLLTGEIMYRIRSVLPTPPPVVKQERPYLWVKGIDSFLENPDMLAKGIVVQVALENASNVGAFNATAESHLTVTNKKSRVLPQSLRLPTKIPQLIPPKGIMLIVLPDVTGMPFDETLIPLIEKKEAFLYIFGDIRYEGENKTAYSCNYCYFYEAKSKTFTLTEFHNECP